MGWDKRHLGRGIILSSDYYVADNAARRGDLSNSLRQSKSLPYLGRTAADELADEAGVNAAVGHQLVVGAAFEDTAFFQDQDLVGVADGGEAVGDDEAGPAGEELGEGPLHADFGERVHAARRFVQDDDPRPGHHRPTEADELPLA